MPNQNYGQQGVEYIEEKTTQKNEENTQKLTKVQLAILKYLAEHPSATRIELSNNIDGVSEDGVKYNLARLIIKASRWQKTRSLGSFVLMISDNAQKIR